MTFVSACAERASRPAESAQAAPPKSEAAEASKPPPPPPSSPLSKIKEGMGMKEVADILGQPTDQGQYVTGKAFIPWYFGDDVTRMQWHYKGIGRVIFSGGGAWGQQGGQVQWVEYDPNESGYRR
jgi:hypothetical protein